MNGSTPMSSASTHSQSLQCSVQHQSRQRLDRRLASSPSAGPPTTARVLAHKRPAGGWENIALVPIHLGRIPLTINRSDFHRAKLSEFCAPSRHKEVDFPTGRLRVPKSFRNGGLAPSRTPAKAVRVIKHRGRTGAAGLKQPQQTPFSHRPGKVRTAARIGAPVHPRSALTGIAARRIHSHDLHGGIADQPFGFFQVDNPPSKADRKPSLWLT